jgi:hypothetical protein
MSDLNNDTFSFDDFGKLSKINSAGLVNSQLSNLWLEFFRHYKEGKFLSANSDLDCLWTILGGEKTIEGSNEEISYFKIEGKLNQNGKLKDSLEIRGFGNIDEKQLDILNVQKGILLEKSLFLRRLQNKQGKGTAYNDGDDEDSE